MAKRTTCLENIPRSVITFCGAEPQTDNQLEHGWVENSTLVMVMLLIVRIDATPTGKVVTLHNLPTYVAEPPEGRTSKGIVVIVPDAFGWEFVNNRLMVDEYARAGDFTVFLPDFMNGNACPLWVIEPLDAAMRTQSFIGFFKNLNDVVRAVYGFAPFLFRNRLSVTMPRVTNFLTEIHKAEAAELPVGAAGFCWGGQHIVQLAAEMPGDSKALVDVCFVAHPSAVSFPNDIEKIRKPLSVAIGSKDPLMTPKQAEETEAVLRKNKVQHEVVSYEGAGHGFSVRTDRTNPKQTEQAVEAEKQAVKWFTLHFEKLQELK